MPFLIEVIHRFILPDLATPAIMGAITNLERTMAMNQAQLTTALGAINTSLTEAGSEIATEIQGLKDRLEQAGNLTPENEEAINAIAAKAQALADVVPNAAPGEQLPQG